MLLAVHGLCWCAGFAPSGQTPAVGNCTGAGAHYVCWHLPADLISVLGSFHMFTCFGVCVCSSRANPSLHDV